MLVLTNYSAIVFIMKRQIYVSQPSEKGGYEVAKWNEKEQNYQPFEANYSEEVAKQRARELNAGEKSY